MMQGTLLSAYVENISTRKDKTVKITVSTQELSPSKAGELFDLMNNLVVVYLCPKEISQKEIDQVDKLDPEFSGKTQSQRIRNVLYKLFEQNSEGFKDFANYYHSKTELIIEEMKSRING
jgi:hypothetical protein